MVKLVGDPTYSELAPVPRVNPSVVTQGIPGEKGEQGEQGIPGLPGAAAGTYVHTQTDPSSTWLCDHDRGRYVNPVVLIDSDPGNPQYTNVQHIDVNNTLISFDDPQIGTATF